MDKNQVANAIKQLREKSPKKKFSQSVDFLVNLQILDLKKPEHKVDLFIQMPHTRGKKMKLCAFVDPQLAAVAKKAMDKVILLEEFDKYKDNKSEQKRLAQDYDFFISQLELMGKMAGTFGKILGSRGKMPSPKAGAVVPGSIQTLEPLVAKLQKTIRLQTKNELSVKASIGTEAMKDEELIENILAVYNTLVAKLPQEKNNVKYAAIKLTMGPIIKIGEPQKEANVNNKKVKK